MRLLRQSTITLVVAVVMLAGCAGPRDEPTLRIAAAVSLLPALNEMAGQYTAAHGVEVEIHAAGSGILVQQIRRGAPVDLFISASADEHKTLREGDLLEPGSERDIAANALAILVPTATSAPSDPSELADERYELIAVGNPATSPVGRYAAQALKYHRLTERLSDRIVLAESAQQVLDYVARGEVDAAIVYRTDARRDDAEHARSLDLAPESHAPIVYRAAVTAGATDSPHAHGFLEYLRSADSRAVLARHGFLGVD